MKRVFAWVLAHAMAASIAVIPSSVSHAQAPLALSAPEQSIEGFGQEWRRARKMARACGASEAYMKFVSYAEGVLIAMKAEEQRKLGKHVEEDGTKYLLGFEDFIDVNEASCKRHQTAMAPIIDALSNAFDRKSELQPYRAPLVACPHTNPC